MKKHPHPLFVFLVLLGVAISFLVYFQYLRYTGYRHRITQDLNRLSAGIQSYEMKYGSFPPDGFISLREAMLNEPEMARRAIDGGYIDLLRSGLDARGGRLSYELSKDARTYFLKTTSMDDAVLKPVSTSPRK